MANEEHVSILRQGAEVWNEWRQENPEIQLDFRGTDLSSIDLYGALLHGADFSESYLFGANLADANLCEARFHGAHLRAADLSHARLVGADLSGAELQHANLSETDFSGANLAASRLGNANLSRSLLSRTALNQAHLFETVFGATYLRETKGLECCEHWGPSIIDMTTLRWSWPLPLPFLRGCGLDDAFIEYLPSLVKQAIELYSCFISYSSKNQDFAERLHADLQNKGVRCWFAPEDLKIGAKTRSAIDKAIRLRDKLLVIFSEEAVGSDWVETEVETAFAEERERGERVLFPVRIDDAVMKTSVAWARHIKDTRHIGDFRGWKDHDSYQNAFKRLLRDLRADGNQ